MSDRIVGKASAVRRAPILMALAAALIVGGLVDRVGGQAPPAARAVVQPVPVAAPADALSSSWFCAGATDGGSSELVDAPGKVVIANAGAATADGQVTLVGSNGSKSSQPVSIGSDSSVSIPESVPGGSPWVGAIVDIEAGAVGVSQMISSPSGTSFSPCATSGSSHWYFSTGETLINAGVEISLLNPYPTDSIVDLSFTTSQGIESPEDFQGFDVPGGGLLTVDLGSHLRRRQAIATTVSVRTGSVVAWKTDWVNPPAAGSALLGTPAANSPLADPAAPIPGVDAVLGAPSVGTTWTWPDGVAGNGIDEQYVIYNPNPVTAQVRLSISLAQAEVSAEPFDLSVGPYQVLPVVSEQQARIPPGVAHSAVLQSTNGVGVVVERTMAAQGASATQGLSTGLGELFGGRLSASQWLVPATLANSSHESDLVVYNPGRVAVKVRVSELAAGLEATGADAFTVPAGQREDLVDSGRVAYAGPLLVAASGPVYVESDVYGTATVGGIGLSLGVPLNP
jgi:hypothetical protein